MTERTDEWKKEKRMKGWMKERIKNERMNQRKNKEWKDESTKD